MLAQTFTPKFVVEQISQVFVFFFALMTAGLISMFSTVYLD